MAPYAEWPATLPGSVLWTRGADPSATSSGPGRVLPDGCVDLILGPRGLMVAGPDTHAHLVPPRSTATWVGLRLPPGIGPVVFGVPAHELRDRRVPLADLWGAAEAGRLERRLGGAPVAEAAELLDDVARRRLVAILRDDKPATVRPDPALGRLVALLGSGASVEAAASAVGVGARQLHRRSLVAFGYGPKTLARILRLTRALDLARAGRPAALVAAEAGYADQPHFSREVRALAGTSLSDLLGRPATGQVSGA